MAARISEGRLEKCRIALYVLSTLCFLASLAMLGGAIYLYIDKSDLLTYVYMMNVSRPACIIVLTIASVTFIIGFLGILAAGMQRKPLLISYCVIVTLAGMTAIAGGGCAINAHVKYTDYIRTRMRDILLNYYGVNTTTNSRNDFITQEWDRAQSKWYCCALEDNTWGVYRSSLWFQAQSGNPEFDRPLVPASCCARDQYGEVRDLQKCQIWAMGPPRLQSSATVNEALFYKGCYTRGTELLQMVSSGVIAIAFILCGIMICCLVLAIMLLNGLRREDLRQVIIRQKAFTVTSPNPIYNNGTNQRISTA